MAGIISINSLEQLKQFIDDKGMIEIVIRDKKKRYADFTKLLINNTKDEQGKETLNKVLNKLDKNNVLSKKNNNALLKNLTKLQNFNLLLNATSLCATCAGFAIMNKKLNNISGQINELVGMIKQTNEVHTVYEFKKVISEHENMLDARKTQKYYTEEQMRKLVDDEYNLLNMLIDIFNKDLTEDRENLIVSIYSLASMLGVSIRYFDELYYYNNKEAIGDGEKWHTSHENWMDTFERLEQEEFITRIQDYGMFELGLTTFETDIYYHSLFDQVKEVEENVRDNQELIVELGSMEMVKAYDEFIRQEVSDEIKSALSETEDAMKDKDFVNSYAETMKQMALAI